MFDVGRSVAGEGIDFVLDAGGQLTSGDASSLAAAFERLHLLWFDEPCPLSNLNAAFKVSNTLSLAFSSQSLNSAAWRYYPGFFSGELAELGKTPEDYYVNPLTDIWNSLSIWNKATLGESLFKLKSLSLKAAQDLHDWTLSAEISTSPLYNATSQSYSLDTSISVLLAWKDVPDINTTIKKTTSTGITY